MGLETMMKPEFCISYDSALGRMGCNTKVRRSMSNLPTIKIDKAKDMVYDENEPVIVRRSSYKSVLPKKLSRFQAQVSHGDGENGRVMGRRGRVMRGGITRERGRERGRESDDEREHGSKVCDWKRRRDYKV